MSPVFAEGLTERIQARGQDATIAQKGAMQLHGRTLLDPAGLGMRLVLVT